MLDVVTMSSFPLSWSETWVSVLVPWARVTWVGEWGHWGRGPKTGTLVPRVSTQLHLVTPTSHDVIKSYFLRRAVLLHAAGSMSISFAGVPHSQPHTGITQTFQCSQLDLKIACLCCFWTPPPLIFHMSPVNSILELCGDINSFLPSLSRHLHDLKKKYGLLTAKHKRAVHPSTGFLSTKNWFALYSAPHSCPTTAHNQWFSITFKALLHRVFLWSRRLFGELELESWC